MEVIDAIDKISSLSLEQLKLLELVMNGSNVVLEAKGVDTLALLQAGFLKFEDGKLTRAFKMESWDLGTVMEEIIYKEERRAQEQSLYKS